jgi:tetratricopeptide (TPR) repeat protein
MRIFRVLVGTAVLLALTAPAMAASQADHDACKGDDPDRSIAACTRIIQDRGEAENRRANAHYNRAIAYRDKGDLDRAIADFTEAIRLNPQHAVALGNRGAAYSAKGDNDRAIADFT